MRNHQQAEKKEQQRIKDIVLNLDFRDENDGTDGEEPFSYAFQPNLNRNKRVGHSAFSRTSAIHQSSVRGRYDGQSSVISHRSASAASNLSPVSAPLKASANSASVAPILKFQSNAGPKISPLSTKDPNRSQDILTHSTQGTLEKNPPNPYLQPRVDKAGKGRANQRGRQLQVSDLDWYETPKA